MSFKRYCKQKVANVFNSICFLWEGNSAGYKFLQETTKADKISEDFRIQYGVVFSYKDLSGSTQVPIVMVIVYF